MAKDQTYVATYQNHTIRSSSGGFIVPEISAYEVYRTLELAKKAIRELRKSLAPRRQVGRSAQA